MAEGSIKIDKKHL